MRARTAYSRVSGTSAWVKGLGEGDRGSRPRAAGMTVLELMIVLAILGGGVVLVRSGFRMLTKADLVESSTELAAMMKRTSQLAIEKGEMHRVLFDLDKHIYVIEVCQGARSIMRNEKVRDDEEDTKRALEKGNEVVTAGGIVGRISRLSDQYVTIEVAPNTEITVQRQAVAQLLPKGTMKSL